MSGTLPNSILLSRGFALLGAMLLSSGCHRSSSNTAATTPAALKPAGKMAAAAPAAIPLPPLPEGGVRGIYLTGWTAGLHNRLNALCGMVDRTELNAMVIDVKDDGELSYDADVPLAISSHASRRMYKVDTVIATLNQHHIWPIARIACMRDTPLAKSHPDLAVHGPDGQVWHDRSRHYWLNPYKKEVWDYNVDVALDAIKHGFKEIQFDYVRFPSEGKISTLQYPGKPPGSLRIDQINAFLKYAGEKITGAWRVFFRRRVRPDPDSGTSLPPPARRRHAANGKCKWGKRKDGQCCARRVRNVNAATGGKACKRQNHRHRRVCHEQGHGGQGQSGQKRQG